MYLLTTIMILVTLPGAVYALVELTSRARRR